MNVVERRKVMCSVGFNLIAVTCVLWSLHVLIEKTRDEVKEGKLRMSNHRFSFQRKPFLFDLEWPFWTKLIVVAIGFTGGLVFLYVQCKMYLSVSSSFILFPFFLFSQLCIRWRQFNQRIVIHSRNEQRHTGLNSSRKNQSIRIFLRILLFLDTKNSDHCIITVLDANDLPPFNSNSLSNPPPPPASSSHRNLISRWFLFRNLHV